MKKITLITAIIGSLLTMNAFAEVKLMVDDNIKVTAINGQEIKHGALQPLKREFTLNKGRHVITARYDRLFDLNREHDYLKSGNITITADLSDGQYELIMPNQPNNYHSAKEYAKNPSLAISQQGKILFQENTQTEREGILSGLGASLGGLFHRDNAVQANQKVIASLDTPSTNTTPVNTPNLTPNAGDDNLDGFMKIWLNSSESEREKIRQWIEK
ncbi:DUF2057 family protein [Moraxella oblonga]|uniref:DUF2057 family protein n=1 Tax=Moraxella oblonga TaxID=200413 RepID=UPI0008378CF7|nr:DUF2057 family protein [Moraxella oblonga]